MWCDAMVACPGLGHKSRTLTFSVRESREWSGSLRTQNSGLSDSELVFSRQTKHQHHHNHHNHNHGIWVTPYSRVLHSWSMHHTTLHQEKKTYRRMKNPRIPEVLCSCQSWAELQFDCKNSHFFLFLVKIIYVPSIAEQSWVLNASRGPRHETLSFADCSCMTSRRNCFLSKFCSPLSPLPLKLFSHRLNMCLLLKLCRELQKQQQHYLLQLKMRRVASSNSMVSLWAGWEEELLHFTSVIFSVLRTKRKQLSQKVFNQLIVKKHMSLLNTVVSQ